MTYILQRGHSYSKNATLPKVALSSQIDELLGAVPIQTPTRVEAVTEMTAVMLIQW